MEAAQSVLMLHHISSSTDRAHILSFLQLPPPPPLRVSVATRFAGCLHFALFRLSFMLFSSFFMM